MQCLVKVFSTSLTAGYRLTLEIVRKPQEHFTGLSDEVNIYKTSGTKTRRVDQGCMRIFCWVGGGRGKYVYEYF